MLPDVHQVSSSRHGASWVSAPVAAWRCWLWQLPAEPAWRNQPRCPVCWRHGTIANSLAVLPPSEAVVQQRGIRHLLGRGKQSPVALPLHSHEIPLLEASLSVGCLLWKQRCMRAAGELFVKYTVCSCSCFGELLLVSTLVVHRWLLMD